MDRLDELGKLVTKHVAALQSPDWLDFILQAKKRSCLHPEVRNLPHPASNLLDHLRMDGATATFTTPPWTTAQKDAAVKGGCHKSATEYQGFLEHELVDFIKKGIYVVLPYWAVCQL
jgi:hypothetical protein